MTTQHHSILINAPKEKVWNTMLGQETYKEWTRAFSEGGHYEGSWDQGSKIVFLGPDPETGKEGGMIARIQENRPYEFVSVEHVGMIKDGIEDTTSEEVKKWTPAFENYTFAEHDGVTKVSVDIDTADDFADTFKEMWPKALGMLKEMCERG